MTDSLWSEVIFSEVFDINPRYQLKRGEQYPYIEMASVGENTGAISNVTLREYTGGGAKFSTGDTLFARITPCLENGKIAQVKTLEDEVGFGSTEFIVIRGREGITDNNFAYYVSISPQVRDFAIQHMTGTSGRQRVPTSVFDNLPILLPPLSEQRAIAEMLGSLDDKIEANRHENETLEATARAIFKSWFVDFDPVHAKARGEAPVGMDAETADLFPDSFVESELGLIPQGWRVESLDTIATYLNGLALQKYPAESETEFLPVIKIRELRQGITDNNSDRASVNLPPAYIINDGDVLFSWSGSLLVDLWAGGTGALNQHLFKVTSGRYPRWLYYFWTVFYLDEFIQIAADKATTMGHIKRQHLNDSFIVVPNEENLDAFTALIEPYIDNIVNNRIQSRTLIETRDALLPKLISGK